MRAMTVAVLLSSTLLVSAAPTVEKAVARKLQSLKGNAIRPEIGGDKRKRTKRAIILEEVTPLEVSEDDVEADPQLAELSNEELELLGRMVQSQLDSFDPQEPEYEIVRIPNGILVPESEGWEDFEPIEAFPRDRRAIPIDMDDEEDVQGLPLQPQLVLVDEGFVEEALADAQRDEIELRERIAELAALLNERAFRGLSR